MISGLPTPRATDSPVPSKPQKEKRPVGHGALLLLSSQASSQRLTNRQASSFCKRRAWSRYSAPLDF